MKTFKFLKYLFLILFSFSILSFSCENSGKDDDDLLETQPPGSTGPEQDPSNTDTNQKKLVKMNIKSSDDYERQYTYNYDNNETLVSINKSWSGSKPGEDTYILEWGRDGIAIKIDEEYDMFYQLSNKKVNKIEYAYSESYYNIEYDTNGYLNKIIYNPSSGNYVNDTEWTWQNDKLIKIVTKGISDYSANTTTNTFTYSSQKCEGFNPIISYYCIEEIMCAIPRMAGCSQQYLPNEMLQEEISIYANEEFSTTYKRYVNSNFKYTFYDDGYLKTCTVAKSGRSESEIDGVIEFDYGDEVYEYFWQ